MSGLFVPVPLGPDSVAARQAVLGFASAVTAALMAAVTAAIDAVIARLAGLLSVVRAVVVEVTSAAERLPINAPRVDSGAVAILLGPMLPAPVAPRILTRPASPSRPRPAATPGPRATRRPARDLPAARDLPSAGGASSPSPRPRPALGGSEPPPAPPPEDRIVSAGLVAAESEEPGAVDAAPQGALGGVTGAPPDGLWAQTAALSLVILLLLGTATYLKSRRRRAWEYSGYYRY